MAENEAQDERTLPDGWVWTTIGEACEVNPRMTRPEQLDDDTPVSFVPMAAVDDVSGAIVSPETRPIGEVWRGYTRFAEGDVIFAKITPCMENGKAAIAKGLLNGIGLGSTEFHVLRPSGSILPQWIYHFVRQGSFRGDAAAKMTGTAGQLRVPTSFMQEAAVPLAPLPEQRRIVAEIETQFTRLDAAVAALKRAQANIRRYKAAVLKAACEGRLVPTEAELAHAEGRTYEPAGQLLARILAERRARWEAEHPGKRYKGPALPDMENLAELPEGWVWTRAEQISYFITKGTTPKAHKLHDEMGKQAEIPFIKVYNLTFDGTLDFSVKPTFVSRETHSGELARSLILPGDVLMNIVGPPLGKVSIVPDIYPEWNMNQAITRFRPFPGYDRKFLSCALRAEHILNWAVSRAKATAGQFNLTLEICRDLPLPLPPLAEQHRIVAEVERRLSVVAALEASVVAALARAGRLRQAVLKQAFEGRLAPQDPDDEPASVLLERIKAERPQRERKSNRKEQPKQMELF